MRVGNRPHKLLFSTFAQRVEDRRCSRSSQNVITLATRFLVSAYPAGVASYAFSVCLRHEKANVESVITNYELRITNYFNGISKLHIAGAQERAFAAWSKNYTRQIKLELSTQKVEDAVVLFNTVMPTLTSGVLFWFTIRLIENPPTSGVIELSLGTFLAFNAAFSNCWALFYKMVN